MKKFLVLIALGLAFIGAPAMAADYDYVGAAYTATDLQDRSGDGFTVDASKSIGSHLFVQGGYRNGFNSDLKAGTASLALGAHTLLGAKTDGYVLARATAVVDDRFDTDKFGYEAEAGVRHLLTERLELRGGVLATELRSISSVKDVRYFGKVGAEYAITKQFRVGADVLAKDGVTEAAVGVRVYF